jgi:periplasmic divalent cation tolerance protein
VIPGSNDAIVVLVTTASAADATRIAEALVSEELAACVNLVGPIQSIYRWEGTVQHDTEQLLLIKTRRVHFDSLEERVRQLHPYAVPEVIALEISAGSEAYLQWIDRMTPARRTD